MKTTKLILVAAMLAFATVGFAQATSPAPINEIQVQPQLALNISLTSALHYPYLVRAMHAQLNPSFLVNEQQTYTVVVRLKNVSYYVYGTYGQWIKFFRNHKAPSARIAAG